MPNVVSIYDDPAAWQYVYIVPFGSIRTYQFLAQVTGGHDSKVEVQHKINGKGGTPITRGRKGAQLDTALTIQDTDSAGRPSQDWFDYQSLVNLLTGQGSAGKLQRHRVLHPALQGMGYREHLYIKRIGVPHRNSGKDPMTSVLTWIEDLPPAQGDGDQTSGGDQNVFPIAQNPPLAYIVTKQPLDQPINQQGGIGTAQLPDPQTNPFQDGPNVPNQSINQ